MHPPIRYAHRGRAERSWQVSVRDNGQGFEAQYSAQIFEPFKRLEGAEVPGNGIGLSTCQRIIERLDGRIWAESQPGKGSTFYFTLPVEGSS
jgi:signal transduction histidine kinase